MTRPTDPGRSAHCFEAMNSARDRLYIAILAWGFLTCGLIFLIIAGFEAARNASHDAALVHAYGSDAGAMMETRR